MRGVGEGTLESGLVGDKAKGEHRGHVHEAVVVRGFRDWEADAESQAAPPRRRG
jgi:hypothetical protein